MPSLVDAASELFVAQRGVGGDDRSRIAATGLDLATNEIADVKQLGVVSRMLHGP